MTMKTIRLHHHKNAPIDFIGIVEWFNEENITIEKRFLKEGKIHREDGPACEHISGRKEWWIEGKLHREDGPALEYSNWDGRFYLEGKRYKQINLKDYVVLDCYNGKYDLMWYKLLGEDKIIDYPDIPGLILK